MRGRRGLSFGWNVQTRLGCHCPKPEAPKRGSRHMGVPLEERKGVRLRVLGLGFHFLWCFTRPFTVKASLQDGRVLGPKSTETFADYLRAYKSRHM